MVSEPATKLLRIGTIVSLPPLLAPSFSSLSNDSENNLSNSVTCPPVSHEQCDYTPHRDPSVLQATGESPNGMIDSLLSW